MLIKRKLESIITDKLKNTHKGVIIYGPRQVGKTTLAKKIIEREKWPTLIVDGDGSKYIDVLMTRNIDRIGELLSDYKMLFVDEAQRIPEVGLILKLIIDNLPDKNVLATGSSALDLASKVSEPLTGRVWTYKLYPISVGELAEISNKEELKQDLPNRLMWGSYPEIFSYPSIQTRKEYLQTLTDAYLYKDLLEFGNIKNSLKIRQLLTLLSYQIGSQVSISELGNQLGLGKEVVANYLDLLTKSFVIFPLSGYSGNLRKEVTRMAKYYFYDLGVRNVFANNFSPIDLRNDIGQLWENYLMVERIKNQAYTGQFGSNYFWRTYTGAELDRIESDDGKLSGFEFKWGKNASRSIKQFLEYYPGSTAEIINRDNWLGFVM